MTIARFAEEGGEGKRLAQQMIRKGQRIHAPRQRQSARLRGRVGGVLQLDLAIELAARVDHHAQQNRQK